MIVILNCYCHWIELQPVKITAVEDVVAELKLSEDYYFEFPFCFFKKAKLKYDRLKSVRLGGPLWDPPMEPNHERVNIKVPPGLCATQCISTGGHPVLGETRTSGCYLFDALIWKWSQIAAIEFNGFLVQNFTQVASDTYVYSVGGTINNEYTDVVLKYSFYFNRWSCCSKLPDKVKEIGSCAKGK